MLDATNAALDDQRVFLHDVSWAQFEQVLAIRGDRAGVRVAYLEGELELMSPSVNHEFIKTMMGRLVEAYADEREIDLEGYGSWTVKRRREKRGLEPDECYCLGPEPKQRPDLAIEVIWTSGGLDKLEIYRKLEVPEVWIWEDGQLTVYLLDGETYRSAASSRLLTDLDLVQLASYVDRPRQAVAVREYCRALRGETSP